MGRSVFYAVAGTFIGAAAVTWTINTLFAKKDIRTAQPEWKKKAYEEKILESRKLAMGDADRLARREAFKNKSA